ncbi:uncharacterized protein PV09_03297 [Verruconis gallopava]|uniref:HAUS augmin-like complex subunit 6 N-terminal domain-containing protein n=1 Tax=Verruconis gallopava TaxID=253628 RepID=A0A0D2B4I0_9PEZI|nr:uncharacterized protein PV09_03297 [Verruconis gallopava]KIW06134.1 hypothetical protein PV09_03297 [Verruconis gallopava]
MSRPAPVAVVSGAVTPNTGSFLCSEKHPLAELLVINLRLLDLHLRDDWPGITAKTFSTKDTQQSQKLRIKCTEWMLYRLFELWDPDETRDKLQPFFPPLEPLQSLNLRAALFRCLNELKKNGVLARESVLRKTMLDECKGEKFMELLVIFSTLVLRKVDASSVPKKARSTAYRIATAPVLSAAQQGSLIPLSVAHIASLRNILKTRQEKRQRYAQFEELLDCKRHQLRQRVKSSVQSKRRESNVNEEMHIKKVIVDNWAGNQSKWAQALLTGDDIKAGDLPLQMPFHDLWPIISDGGSLDGDATNMGLLTNLQKRVQTQKERLSMWQEFQENLKDDEHDGVRDATEKTVKITNFKFDRHQRFQFIPGRVIDGSRQTPSAINETYSGILHSLRAELNDASKLRRTGGPGWTEKYVRRSEFQDHDVFSPIKSSSSVMMTGQAKKLDITQNQPTLHPLSTVERSNINGFKIHRLGRNDSKSDSTNFSTTMEPSTGYRRTRDILTGENRQPTRSATPEMVASPINITQPSPENSTDVTVADHIISSIVNATPSPAKQSYLSLTERTRMSMAFLNGGNNAAESSETDIVIPSANSSELDPKELPPSNNVQRRVSLLERTRLSMAAIPAQAPKSRKSLATKQKRESLYPINQFETPGKPHRPPSPRRDATPTEKLFSDDAEYASVFKSRPRVALSPVFSPEDAERLSLGGQSPKLDLDEIDRAEEEDDAGQISGFRTSPLATRRRMAAG